MKLTTIRGGPSGNCNRICAGALSRPQSGLSGGLSPGRSVTLLPHSAPKDRCRGAACETSRAGKCQQAETQVDGTSICSGTYEGLIA